MKSIRLFTSTGLVVAGICLSACAAAGPPPTPQVIVVTATPSAPQAAATATFPPPAVEQPTQPNYAPNCPQGAAESCSVPEVEIREYECISKQPYTYVSMPAGTTYEVLSPGFTCGDDYLLTDGLTTVVTCTGPELMVFDLRFCNPACEQAPVLDTSGGQCQDGYGYDAARMCCSQMQQVEAGSGCSQIRVDIKSCPGPKK
ncbi:MAG: hypothetical protein JXA13_03740 [Anaerolineales bacterium]|nr:hypothetical protein [Anaerolineales bacterium]